MNIVFTCGGTGGHIYPAIAVANLMKQKFPDCRILFIGAEDGLENKIVPNEGFELRTLKISNFQRGRTWEDVRHNLQNVSNMQKTMHDARAILQKFSPDVIVGTGGYASFPALRMGGLMGIPTCVHESNAVPGLTTKLVELTAKKIMVSFENCSKAYLFPEKVVVTGTPVRREFFAGTREEAREKLALDNRPFILSFWGSLGAREMNRKITGFFLRECENGEPFQHMHVTGSFGWRWMPEYIRERGVLLEDHPGFRMCEYQHDMPTCMKAADLIICRSGAATMSEICASATPCILVPSPNVTDNHQEKNARVLEQAGAAQMLLEENVDAEELYDGRTLFDLARSVLADSEKQEAMRMACRRLAVANAAERIAEVAIDLARGRK